MVRQGSSLLIFDDGVTVNRRHGERVVVLLPLGRRLLLLPFLCLCLIGRAGGLLLVDLLARVSGVPKLACLLIVPFGLLVARGTGLIGQWRLTQNLNADILLLIA